MAFRVTVASVEQTNKVLVGTLQVNLELGARSTCDFAIRGTTAFQPGQVVIVQWDSTRIFGGTIEEVQTTSPAPGERFTQIRCVDWSQLLDRYYVTFARDNVTLGELVHDLVFVHTKLWVDGVTLGAVAEGPELSRVVFNYKRVSDVLNDLAEISGLSWKIDADRVLTFFDRADYTAPFSIGDADKAYRGESYRRSRSTYYNRVWLRAGKDKTDLRTEYFRGDAPTVEPAKRRRTFTLSFPVGELVRIQRFTAGIPVTQRVGIKEVDEDGDVDEPGWKQWFYQKGEPEITQNRAENDTANPTLSNEEVLAVTYYGSFPLIVDAQSDPEIAARAAIEGGSGEYQHVEDDEHLDGRDLGVQKTARLLQKFGRIPGTLEYEVDRVGLEPGQLQTSAIADLGLASTQLLINTVTYSFPRTDLMRCRVQALDGERVEGWSDFFRKQAERGRKFAIAENEKIVIVRSFRETIAFTDAFLASTDAGDLVDYIDDPYTFGFYGFVIVSGSGDQVGAAGYGRSRYGSPHGS